MTTVTTAIGDLEVVFPRADRALVSTPGSQPVKLGVSEYTLSARFLLAEDGEWGHVEGSNERSLHYWGLANYGKVAPPTFVAKAIDAAKQAIAQAIAADPMILHEAGVSSAQTDVRRARDDVDKLRAQLAQAERELADAEAALLAAQAA